jgi:transforming growth factor-beta-induced protein
MKLTFLSKSVRTIGLVAMLSLTVGMAANATGCTKSGENKVAVAAAVAQAAQVGTVVEIAAGNSSFSTLVTAVKAAGLAETLSGKGPFTVFAPTNEAFAALPKGTLEKLLKPENRDLLRKVLTYHVVSGDLMAQDLRSGNVTTVAGSTVAVKVQNGKVSVNNANVVQADVDAKNGVIHVIDKVLLPPDLMPATPVATQSVVEIAAGNPTFSTLVTAVKAAGLAETLSGKGPFTVFAPTNEAFAALPKGTLEKLLKPENRDLLKKVLTYHVVSGDLMAKDLRSGNVTTVAGSAVAVKVQNGKVSVNNANVVKADVDAKNGVIHVIDKVLLPPELMAATPVATQSVVEIAAGNPSFSTLVTAVKAAGLAETLSGKGPFTVFAPTNEAFAALPKGTLEKLLKSENRDLLRKVLTYHVVSGDLMAKDLRSGKVTTVAGSPVTVQVSHSSVKVNNANVVKADIDAKNGVVHVIDRVLLPPN